MLRPLPFSGLPIDAMIFWGVCVLWMLPEIIASIVKRSSGSSKASDRGSLRVIALLWWAGIAAGFAVAFLLPQSAIHWRRTRIFFAGIALMVGGTVFRWYSVAVLGKYFTFDVAIHNEHALIQAGPYRYIRHPSYTGALVTLLGFGLALGNWASLLVAISCLSLGYAYRIPVEEAALIAALGDSYKAYVSRTWRLVPFLF